MINEEIIDSFLNFLDGYISKNANESNKNAFLEFYKQYEYCLGISTEFPKYIKKLVKSELSLMNFEELKLKPSMIVDLENQDSLISYLREKKIKYFSNLIPRPISIVLKHSLTEQERELFTSDLFHIFNFKYWGTKNSVEILDNFKEVYRLWLREK